MPGSSGLLSLLFPLILVFAIACGGGDGAGDTGSGDTGSGDTGSGDTSAGDTSSGDTGSGDTGSGDTGSGDTGSGDGGVCVNPGAPSGELLWLTLDDAASISSPLAGNGAGSSFSTTPADDFVAGQTCAGLRIDADGEFLQVRQASNIDFARGTIDFWYLPDAGHRDGNNHVMFTTTSNSTRGGFTCRKAAMDNGNAFQVIFFDDAGTFSGETVIDVDDYAFAAGTWVDIRVTWDFGVGGAEQNIRIYFDGVEPTYTNTTTGPASMPAADADELIRFGVRDRADEWSLGGVMDEIRIWDSVIAP